MASVNVLSFSKLIETAKMATHRCANLDVISTNRATIVHRIKGGDFVNPHRGHLEQSCDFIHDADTRKTMLSLTQV